MRIWRCDCGGCRGSQGWLAFSNDTVQSCSHAETINRPAALSIVQQFPALIGVAVGALASYLASTATERARWRREQASRWDDRRAQAYAEYGYAVKNVYVQCQRLADLHAMAGSQADMGQALAELDRLSQERTAKWELVLLLGDPATIASGRAWHRRVWHLELLARGEVPATDRDRLTAAVNADRSSFYATARKDLGITSGDIPLGGPWERPTPDSAQ